MVESVRSGGIDRLPQGIRDGPRPGDGRFSVGDQAEPLVRNAPVSMAPSLGLESLLALQSVNEAIERDRATRRRGMAMVAALSDLQRAMLAREDPSLALRSLSELAAGDLSAGDAELGAILRAIVLRSRVEVARRARGPG